MLSLSDLNRLGISNPDPSKVMAMSLFMTDNYLELDEDKHRCDDTSEIMLLILTLKEALCTGVSRYYHCYRDRGG